MVRSIMKVMDNWEEILCVLLLGASVVVGAASVFWRYALGDPFIWSEEGLRILLVWLTFIGMSMGIKKKAHMRLDLVDGMLEGQSRTVLELVNGLLVAAFSVVLLLASWRMVQANWDVILVASGLPSGIFYLPIALGTASMAVRSLVHLVTTLNRRADTGATARS